MEIKVEQSNPAFNPVTVNFTITDEKLLKAIKYVSSVAFKKENWVSVTLCEMVSDEQEAVDQFIDDIFNAISTN